MPQNSERQAANPQVMQDFIFGGIESDEAHLLAAQRELRRGIRHQHQIDPLDPMPGQSVQLTVTVGADVALDRLLAHVQVTFDASSVGAPGHTPPQPDKFTTEFVRQEVRWEPLIWAYVEVWQADLPGQPAGALVQYTIEGRQRADAPSLWASEPNMDGTVESAARYGYHVDQWAPPAWAHGAVVYQIFVDRFAGAPSGWLPAAAMNDFAGGTLAAITQKLPYIVDLGVSTIWLSPIFVCDSYHGYDTVDFYNVDPRFGTNAELRTLVQEAHRHGLRVLLDFVANHTSVHFAPFAAAQTDECSPYRAWFSFDAAYKHGYRCFFDVAAMPQLNTDHPAVRQFLGDAAVHWLAEYDVDGFRLDYAAGPSHAFWSEFYARCKSVKPDCWLFGEVTRPGAALRTYTGRLDGCLDFGLTRLLRQLCGPDGSSISMVEFANYIVRNQRFFGAPGRNFLLPSFLDNHDMNRFLWAVGNDKARLKMAATLLFGLGGPPILYYGAEVGLSQPRSKAPWLEEARHPMLWGDAQDADLHAFFKRLIALRRRQPALWHGAIETLHLDNARGVWLAQRTHGDNRVLIVVNVSAEPRSILLPDGKFVGLTGEAIEKEMLLAAGSANILCTQS
ncbi:MAG: alpha-amylase family glycosyl hydrolase [Caldilineaceae bacterium]